MRARVLLLIVPCNLYFDSHCHSLFRSDICVCAYYIFCGDTKIMINLQA